MEILDLIAKISWDTNTKELQQVSEEMKKQDKLLDELRVKGGRLEKQILSTNDPKKLAAYNRELQATKRAADQITEAQKKQVEVTKNIVKEQKNLQEQLRKTNDPNAVKGLLQNLHKVENQMTAVSGKAQTMGNKLGGLGQNIMAGLGIGAGAFGVQQLVQGISSFFTNSIQEAQEAEQGLLRFKQTLENIGQAGLFDKLVSQADTLAKTYQNLFDNDDIIAGQAKFIEGTKVSEEQLSKLIPVAIELAAKLGTDVTTASEMLVNSIIGRTSPELKRLGLDMKGLGDETSRVNEITGDFANLLNGSVDTALQTSQGQAKQLRQELANLEEDLGSKLLPLQKMLTKIKLGLVNIVNEAFTTDSDRVNQNIEKRASSFENVLKIKGANLTNEQLDATIDKRNKEVDFIKKIIKGNEDIINQHKSVKGTMEAERRIAQARVELVEREGQLVALQNFKNSKNKKSKAPINKNAGQDEDLISTPKKIATTKPKPKPQEKPKEKPVIEVDLNVGEVTFDEAPKALEQKAVTAIENSPEFAYNEWFKKIQEDRKKEKDAQAEIDKQSKQDAKMQIFDETMALANAAQQAIDIEKEKNDRLIALQEERVEATKGLSDKSLRIEQDRLDDLLAKREKYEQQQRIIDAGIIVANQALAVSNAIVAITKAARDGGAAAPFIIAANVIAIAAGILAATSAVKSVDAGFKDGGYTGDGDPNDTSTNLGNRGYKYHKKEFVMDEDLTSKHRDLFEGLHKRDLVVKQLDDGKFYITKNGLDTDSVVSDHQAINQASLNSAMLYEMQGIKELLKQRELNVQNNFDAQGFGQAVAGQMTRITLKNKMRTW